MHYRIQGEKDNHWCVLAGRLVRPKNNDHEHCFWLCTKTISVMTKTAILYVYSILVIFL